MNKTQQDIINKLKQKAKEFGYSPKRRDVSKLAWECYNTFGSFSSSLILFAPNGNFDEGVFSFKNCLNNQYLRNWLITL